MAIGLDYTTRLPSKDQQIGLANRASLYTPGCQHGQRNSPHIDLATNLAVACSLVAVLGVFAIQFPLDAKGFGHPFALFLASVFMVALMFGRMSGFFAVGLSALLSTAFFARINSVHLMHVFKSFKLKSL